MTDYNNGAVWGWNGGKCPVHPETVVRYWMRNCGSCELEAKHPFWGHVFCDSDIIAFQVVKVYVEPKTIWAARSMHSGKILRAFDDEDNAYRYANIDPGDCSIEKYQEVKE